MKVLHVNQSDTVGGAAIAAHRLHEELLDQDIGSKLLVDVAKSHSELVDTIPRRRYVDSISSRLAYYTGLNYTNHLSTFKLTTHSSFQEADVLNFHNLHGDYFNYLALSKLTRSKPAVLTLHDMWSFTGHCAYSFGCDRWKTGCGRCPDLKTYPAVSCDRTALEWRLKQWVYNRARLTIVSPSQWLSDLVKKSLLSHYEIHTIPNGLNTQVYRPLDRSMCRSALDLPLDGKVLLFTAQSLQDPRKGGDLLRDALKKLPASVTKDLTLLVFGEDGEALESGVNIPVVSLGYVGGDRIKSIAYSSADVFVFPTRADNLPIVIQESMACGTPTVSFSVGGVPELVRPGITGLLANPADTDSLAEKMTEILSSDSLRDRMAQHCRDIAVKDYDIKMQVEKYTSLYKSMNNIKTRS